MAHVPILEEHASDLVERIDVKGSVLVEKLIEKGVMRSEDARNIRVHIFVLGAFVKQCKSDKNLIL